MLRCIEGRYGSIADLMIACRANGEPRVRRIVLFSMLILQVMSAPPSHAAAASSSLYNDPHGQWSLLVPDTYKKTLEQYNLPTKTGDGFSATSAFNAPGSHGFAVQYIACCAPDAAKLALFAQSTFDRERRDFADVRMVAEGIHPATLGGQTALQFDFTETKDGVPLYGRETVAFSGGLAYALGFIALDTTFVAMAGDIASISDSFRFATRSVSGGVYNDPQGRFTFAAPPGYDLAPNPLNIQSNTQESLVTLASNPASYVDDDTNPVLFVQTVGTLDTFDTVFDTFSTAGIDEIRSRKGAEVGDKPVRHAVLDGHPTGVEEWHQHMDTGVFIHGYAIFTVVAGEVYILTFNFPDDKYGSPVNPIDTVLASFKFQFSG